MGIQKNTNIVGLQTNNGQALILQQKSNPYLQLSVKHFAVMFNLDVSGSMSGNKWSAVCSSVNNFISKMGQTDLVSGLVFNDKVQLISNLKEGDELLPKPKTAQKNTLVITNGNGEQQECELQ